MVNEDDVRKAYEAGELSEYFYNQYLRKAHLYDEPSMEGYLDEARIMSKLGIDSVNDQKIWFYIYTFADEYLEDIVIGAIPSQAMPAIQAEVFAHRNEFPIDTHLGHYFALARAAKVVGLPIDKSIEKRLRDAGFLGRDENNASLNVIAYPQGWTGSFTQDPYDIGKWMKATRDIYLRAQNNYDLDSAFNEVTAKWDKMEKLEYKHWLRFYQENAQNKYKIAQDYGGAHEPILYSPNLRSTLPSPIMPHIDHADNAKAEDQNDIRERIETQRSKIISRLHSAEKLLSSLDGQLFAGDDQEYMLKMLQDLKRKVQIANKLTAKSSLFEDYIYKAANYCHDIGKEKAARFFYKVAQAEELDTGGGPGAPPPPGKEPTESVDEMAPSPDAPPMGEGSGEPSPLDLGGSGGEKEGTKEAFKEFFQRLETGMSTELNDDYDKLELDDQWIVEAQALPAGAIPAGPPLPDEAAPPPAPAPKPPAAPKPPPPEDIEVTEEEAVPDEKPDEIVDNIPDDHASNAIEAALQGTTVQDVIARLEVISAMLKHREIARELAIADLELDHLGLNAYFPGLGEAHRSALESTQYMSTRVDEILSKLKGASIDTSMTIPEDKEGTPETESIKSNLQELESKEEERKKRRRDKEEAKAGGETGAGEAAPKELAGPAEVESAAPMAPGRPAAPPLPVR